MRLFAALIDQLVLTQSRNGKLRLLEEYFRTAPDPDRGYGLAALTGDLDLNVVKPALLRNLAAERIDEVLFKLSYDYVGDLAETISLIWSSETGSSANMPLGELVVRLKTLSRLEAPRVIEALLTSLEPSSRYAFLKLATGGLRIGLSARLAKQALANFGNKDVTEIEEIWHGLQPPYAELFAWLEDRAAKPEQAAASPFRPVMLANAIREQDFKDLSPADYIAEWKWDGIRVQATSEKGVRRLYSRSGDDISAAFPDLLEHMDFEGSLDGELLVFVPGIAGLEVAKFSDLQQRLNRKSVSKKVLADYPVFMRVYDILFEGTRDTRYPPLRRTARAAGTLCCGPEPGAV